MRSSYYNLSSMGRNLLFCSGSRFHDDLRFYFLLWMLGFSLLRDTDSDFAHGGLFLQCFECWDHIFEGILSCNHGLDVVCFGKSGEFGDGTARESGLASDYDGRILVICVFQEKQQDLPIFAPKSILGTNSAGRGWFAVNMPSTVISPPILVEAMLFISVPAPPVSTTWSTPLPSVSLSTSCSQSGVCT
jgi:hypothetical protein